MVEALLGGPLRFNELQEQIEGIAPNILSNRLRRLEQDGLAVAQPYSERPPPPRVRADRARPRAGGSAAACWPTGARATPRREPVVAHAACGTALEARWYCPTCDQTVDEPGDEGLHYA